jgi:hypothetical protein
MPIRSRSAAGCAVLIGLFVLGGASGLAAPDTLPDRLTDQQFWHLSEQLSEPNGSFRSDNLLSNEQFYPLVMPQLTAQVRPGGVYLGVGPEQNFNYIVALRPKMAFITDIRRGNLHTQLMYKALFELSADRGEFVSRLFTKPRPPGLDEHSTAADLMNAYWDIVTSGEPMYQQNWQAIKDCLTRSPHRLPLDQDDLDGIEYVYRAFYWYGPDINYNSSSNGGGRGGTMTNYARLMMARDDGGGPERSFLASEAAFRLMKDLEARNLIVPVVGNFGGPKALRAVGQYVRDHHAVVAAFYLSNVEQYLNQEGIWGNFCANVATMPLDEQSTFIRSGQGGFGFGGGGGLRNSLGPMLAETQACRP